jgi:uncharacterized membrane protein
MGALTYPLLVWRGLSSLPPAVVVLAGIACIALRMIGPRVIGAGPRTRPRVETIAFLLAAIVLVALLALAPRLAARAYPVAVSLAVACVFAVSLWHPPTVIERIARLSEPDLPPDGVAYTRQVTRVWVAFLLANATISMGTAVYGSLDQWALWNGLLSYIAMGALFAGEFLVRQRVRLPRRR